MAQCVIVLAILMSYCVVGPHAVNERREYLPRHEDGFKMFCTAALADENGSPSVVQINATRLELQPGAASGTWQLPEFQVGTNYNLQRC